jgi:acyl carrier protein
LQPMSPLEHELAQLIVDTVHLETTADTIDPTAPLFGEGLGLDSIDALEIALAISYRPLKLLTEERGTRTVA